MVTAQKALPSSFTRDLSFKPTRPNYLFPSLATEPSRNPIAAPPQRRPRRRGHSAPTRTSASPPNLGPPPPQVDAQTHTIPPPSALSKLAMADPADRDQITDEEEDVFMEEEEEDRQGLGSEGEEGGVGSKRKRLGKSLGGFGKRGVCYLSRVPPHMNPSHIRQMLSKYGDVLRIYLVPEGQGHRKHATVKAKAYSEGWIEFAKKSIAKRVANLLNGEQIGGKKRSSFYYDIWNIKYLRKFKWDDLVGETAERTHIREQKLTLEIAAAKKQRDHYLSNVEKSRALKHIQERRKKKQKTEGAEPSNVLETKIARPIPQKKPVGETDAKTKSKLSKDILAGVFGGSS